MIRVIILLRQGPFDVERCQLELVEGVAVVWDVLGPTGVVDQIVVMHRHRGISRNLDIEGIDKHERTCLANGRNRIIHDHCIAVSHLHHPNSIPRDLGPIIILPEMSRLQNELLGNSVGIAIDVIEVRFIDRECQCIRWEDVRITRDGHELREETTTGIIAPFEEECLRIVPLGVVLKPDPQIVVGADAVGTVVCQDHIVSQVLDGPFVSTAGRATVTECHHPCIGVVRIIGGNLLYRHPRGTVVRIKVGRRSRTGVDGGLNLRIEFRTPIRGVAVERQCNRVVVVERVPHERFCHGTAVEWLSLHRHPLTARGDVHEIQPGDLPGPF